MGPTDHKIKYSSLSHVFIGNKFFKKAPKGIFLKRLCENEVYLGVSSVHSGACGALQAGHKMKWL